jgi:uncharacterized membrane protein YkgB
LPFFNKQNTKESYKILELLKLFDRMKGMRKALEKFDIKLINLIKKSFLPFARFALFVVFFWFGILKIFYLSPANPMVSALLEKTLPFFTFNQFIFLFGLYEMLIGLCFLFPKLSRLAILLLAMHMFTTLMPLILVPQATWSGFFVPTLEGQYIIKNLVIISTAMGIASHMTPLKFKNKP